MSLLHVATIATTAVVASFVAGRRVYRRPYLPSTSQFVGDILIGASAGCLTWALIVVFLVVWDATWGSA